MRPLGKESPNYEDHSADTPLQNYLHNIAVKLNPVYAARNVRAKLINEGIIKLPGTDEMLARIEEEVRKRHADERAHPPKGFTIDAQGNYIPDAAK
jgi:hypothetical protein